MEAAVSVNPQGNKITLFEHFSELQDPRRQNKNMKHNLMNIIVIAICAVIANANDWNEIELWARSNEDWLKTFLALSNGIPSHDTFNRVFSALDPQAFVECFASWIYATKMMVNGTVIAVDGKRLRRSHSDAFGKSALHLVSAWASDLHVSLGQVKTSEKSNEITAIPELLQLLSIKGCIVTIDAMGCQKNIASLIRKKGADYILALKKNHERLHREVKEHFEKAEETGFKSLSHQMFCTQEKSHGRRETRTYVVSTDLSWMGEKKAEWSGLKSIVMVVSERKLGRGKVAIQKRFYLTSLEQGAEKIAGLVRSHWSIENTLHWQLDVNFKEDQSRLRSRNNAENFAAIRRMTLSLLKQEKSKKLSMKCKRFLAGMDNNYLLKILTLGGKPQS